MEHIGIHAIKPFLWLGLLYFGIAIRRVLFLQATNHVMAPRSISYIQTSVYLNDCHFRKELDVGLGAIFLASFDLPAFYFSP